MRLINCINLSKSFSSEYLFKELNLQINSKSRLGIIGVNGSGKTTLLRIISGIDKEYEGICNVTDGVIIGYVKQKHESIEDYTVTDVLLMDYQDIIHTVHALEEKLADPNCPDPDKTFKEYTIAREHYDNAEIDKKKAKINALLHSLGLENKNEQLLSTLSGGERNIVDLAKELFKEPDILILDEPGNYLDFEGLSWLEKFLSNLDLTIIIVSHDRYMLDKLCTSILEIENKKATYYSGNYSEYRLKKLKQLVAAQADFKANQRRLHHLEETVRKYKEITQKTSNPKWGKRLQAKRKQLAREIESAVDKPEIENSKIAINISNTEFRAEIVLKVKNYSRSIEDRLLFNKINLTISNGEKVGIIGPNGCGKSTFLNDIMNNGCWENDTIKVGASIKIGYMSQYIKNISDDATIEDFLMRLGPLNRNEAFSLIAPFLFNYEDMSKKVSELSGGELKRLQLAMMIFKKPNFLILDEPVNHFDISSREIIEESFQNFTGAILVVSHDRYFLDKIVSRVFEIRNKKMIEYLGNFSQFWYTRTISYKNSDGRLITRGRQRKNTQNTETLKNKQQKAEFISIEKKIDDKEKIKVQLEKDIIDAFSSGDHIRGRHLSVQLEKHSKILDELYNKWESMLKKQK